MTCIVGVVTKDRKIIMGGDSAGVRSGSLTIFSRKDSKVFIKGPFVIGFTSSFRMGQLLKYQFSPPEHPMGMSDEEYMTTLFIESVRSCLKDGGFATIENSQENGGTFLVGYKDTIYRIEDDFQVAIENCDYCSVGCGESIARGSLYTTGELGVDPKKRVQMALVAAQECSAGVRGPFIIAEIGGTEKKVKHKKSKK